MNDQMEHRNSDLTRENKLLIDAAKRLQQILTQITWREENESDGYSRTDKIYKAMIRPLQYKELSEAKNQLRLAIDGKSLHDAEIEKAQQTVREARFKLDQAQKALDDARLKADTLISEQPTKGESQ